MSKMEEKTQQFLNQRVNPILQRLVKELIVNQPDNVTQFMIKWLQNNGSKIQESSKKNNSTYQIDSEGSDDDEDAPEIDLAAIMRNQSTSRVSVSAQAYGMFHQQSDFQAKVIQKSEGQKGRIKKRLEQAFMFQALDENQKQIVIDAMIERKANPGETIITQGEDGDMLYVVDEGELDCLKWFKKGEDEKHLKIYREGESFGELALLYNAPRAATIQAKSQVILFGLDRETFNHIVKDAASKKREKYENFLSKVDLLHDMSPYERLQVADALQSQTFQQGQFIVKQGQFGDVFYILENGQCQAIQNTEKGPQVVLEYQSGDYFGELALLKNATRAASIMAKSDGTVVFLDRNSFKRLLGPVQDILRRNFSKYEQYMG